jgi:hypothetical protein
MVQFERGRDPQAFMNRLCLTCRDITKQKLRPYSPGVKMWWCLAHNGIASVKASN